MGDNMNLKIGDIVSRNSHGNDIYFKIIEVSGNVAILKGIDLRLYAIEEDRLIIENNKKILNLDRSEYFYLPGKILHIDGDNLLNNYNKIFMK